MRRSLALAGRPKKRLLSFGEGYLGCTGHKHYQDVLTATPIADGLECVPVQRVGAGWGHSAVLQSDGRLLLCGRTHDFQNTLRQINLKSGPSWLAHAINYVSDQIVGVELTPQRARMPAGHSPSFVEVACSPGSLTVVVSKSGGVHCIGSNDHGQCGLGYVSPSVYEVSPVPGFGKGQPEGRAVAVSAGFQHVLAVTESGGLYGWGRGDRGQLGLSDREAYKSPLQVLGRNGEIAERKVTAVATGFSNSAILTDDGTAWVFGKMQSDKLAASNRQMADELAPRRLPLDTDARPVFLSCGQAHVCVMTDDNVVWMTGLRGRGVWYDETTEALDDYCLKVMDPSNRLTAVELTQVEPLSLDLNPHLDGATVTKLVSGVHHAYAILSDGRVLMWGWKLHVVPLAAVADVFVYDLAPGFGHMMVVGGER